jgi:hypothetical protein
MGETFRLASKVLAETRVINAASHDLSDRRDAGAPCAVCAHVEVSGRWRIAWDGYSKT